MVKVIEPELRQVLDFCALEPVERVFLEDVARRGLGRFVGVRGERGLDAVCHVGANVVPSGRGCGAFAGAAARGHARMIIGEEIAVGELWEAAAHDMPAVRQDRPGQPVYAMVDPPPAGDSGVRTATLADVELLVPACAAAHEEELGVDPLARDEDGFRWRTSEMVEEGRSWLWRDGDTILFKAEASAWTAGAVQLQQVWVDPAVRRRGYGTRGLRDLCRLLLETTPVVTLFVRTDNAPALALYESIGMLRVGSYRSVLF
ncbi:MAG: GNAT family N-acetyltransferase [Actinobacteria bacterium]|nr:GNAT family N-acetyltransferase [Actinomycetota bacterium]